MTISVIQPDDHISDDRIRISDDRIRISDDRIRDGPFSRRPAAALPRAAARYQ